MVAATRPDVLQASRTIAGHNGALYNAQDGKKLLQVDRFEARIRVENERFQPTGSFLRLARPVSGEISLTFQEMVVTDAGPLTRLLSDVQFGEIVEFAFMGEISPGPNRIERIQYNDCILDGDVSVQNVQTGQILRRPWTFHVNSKMDVSKLLA